MSDESTAALDEAVHGYRRARAEAELSGQDPGGVSSAELKAAARAHLDASRDLQAVQAEYAALDEAEAAGQQPDPAARAALGQELAAVRRAAAILEGNLPGAGHAASAGIGA